MKTSGKRGEVKGERRKEIEKMLKMVRGYWGMVIGRMLLERSVALVVLLAVIPAVMLGQTKERPAGTMKDAVPARVTGSPTYAVLNINNITTWMRYDGHSNHSPSGDVGMYYPRGTGSVIYQDCLVWGGKVFRDAALTDPAPFQPVRVGGGTYGVGTRAGRVIGSGASAVAEDPSLPAVRIYRIRRDYYTMGEWELQRDAASVNEIYTGAVTATMMTATRAQYALDWANWPVDRGAPFIDRNGNGVYDPPPPFNLDWNAGPIFTVDSLIPGNYDEPGVAGRDVETPADQVIWTVYNDLNEATARSFLGSYPLGLEVQKTMWGYKGYDALGSIYFVRFKFINKGGVDTSSAPGTQPGSFWIDSMYVAQFSDPDLGNAGDDLIGCDSLLSLGYCYNGSQTDAVFRGYNLPPPAVGYDFLAGATVPSPGDSAIVNFIRRYDRKNLPLTSFAYFSQGSPYSDPPTGDANYPSGSGRWWKMLRGFAPLGDFSTADLEYNRPPQFPPSKYPYSGDPVTGHGWLDGVTYGTMDNLPGDRRMVLSSGPFSLAPGDTQEVYVGVVAGLGADRLSSITAMRLHDRTVQTIFDRGFQAPGPPSSPAVTIAALDGEIVLSWGSDATTVARTEGRIVAETYHFEGYVVYQLPSATAELSEGARVGTFDLVNGLTKITEPTVDRETGAAILRVVQDGSDTGVRRSIRITEDVINGPVWFSGREVIPLVNGREYFFAVTAYNVNMNPAELPVSFESEPVYVSVKPQVPFGLRPVVGPGDTLAVVQPSGSSPTRVVPIVVDPLAGTGDTLQVRFSGLVGQRRWTVINVSRGVASVASGTNFSGDERYPMVGGILVKVVHDTSTGPAADSTNIFEFTIPAPSQGRAVELAGVERIGVFPNPYYAQPTTPYGASTPARQFVTFNNLPQRATVRIFNLGGHLVRTLRKDDASQFLVWDLENEDGWLVASGMYLCHVELPDLGVAKVLKLGVVASMEGVR